MDMSNLSPYMIPKQDFRNPLGTLSNMDSISSIRRAELLSGRYGLMSLYKSHIPLRVKSFGRGSFLNFFWPQVSHSFIIDCPNWNKISRHLGLLRSNHL